MIVLLDQNILLDLFLNRAPWAADAATLWQAHVDGRIRAAVAAFTVPTMFYVLRRHADLAAARGAIQACVATLEIAPLEQPTLVLAESLNGPDFEDDLQLACAIQFNANAVITRDPNGFPNAPLPIWSPADLIARLPPTAPP
jgi:predicted nucleic acid-binding protein